MEGFAMGWLRLWATWIVATLVLGVGTAWAQEPGRVYKIGWLWLGEPGLVQVPFEKMTSTENVAFREALRDRGFVVGKNLIVDVRNTQGDEARLPGLAEALIATQPDVLVTGGTLPTVAAMRATKTIPIVFPGLGAPVEREIVKSLVNHGGNATGQAVNLQNPKAWQLLHDAAPTVRRAGYVVYAPQISAVDRSPEYRARNLKIFANEAAQAGFEMIDLAVDRLEELEPKVAALANDGKAVLFIHSDATLISWRTEIMMMAMRHRLPTACTQFFGWAKEGCLITYGENDPDRGRRAAAQVVKIFNGTKPADIPIEQATRFRLIVNAKTAKALDLTLPSSLIAMADEVID
jgi:putative ABC transport system substrate-binding protein